MNPVVTWAMTHPLPAGISAVLLLAAVVLLVRSGRKAAGRPPAAVLVASLSAMACTAYSADTSWRFAADYLGMASPGERGAMFAAAELALFSCALMARQNLNAQGAPGTPGVLVWVITGVQVIPAYSESGIVGGTVRAVVGPVLAALLWHLAMGIELRHSKPGAKSASLPAVLARELRERLLSRLGLATRNRTAEQITRDRATVKAVALAAKLSEMKPGARGRARVSRRLSVAVGKAQAGASEEQRQKLLDLLAARRHAASLATIDLPSPWQTAPEPVVEYAEPVTAEPVPEPYPELPEPVPAVPDAVPAGVRLLPVFDCPGELRRALRSEIPTPVLAAETLRTRTEVRAEYVPVVQVGAVPDWTVPGDYEDKNGNPTEPDEDVEYPDPLIPQVRADFPDEVPGVRRLKETYSIGQPRAQRIRDELLGVRS